MWLKKKRAQITLPAYVMEYLEGLASTMGSNKSDTIEAVLLYVSMPGHEEDFKSQFSLVDEEEEEDDEEEDEEDGEGPSIGEVLGLGVDEEEEEEE